MPVKTRPSPTIPDHEVLRKIGGGSYGEVWLARGVTGALRAVKVVWREDFEDTRGFEREFEGILKFEPISRDHPALMNILHVGRSPDGVSFYYYVMEIGDDVRTGRDINPIEYEPRTLRADHHQATGEQWATDDCIDVGLRLAQALEHLHENGLAHRDVKPSNVIFVNGKAKLADIGLVAARGQRTFVGTEGFVPPEGPGSAQADVYSLGKVLYEIATGKDRMNFPELPDEIATGGNRKRWLELNRIICEVCEPRISKRKISTASELALALSRIQRGKKRRRGLAAIWLASLMLLTFASGAGWFVLKDTEWGRKISSWFSPPEVSMGMLRVFSTPEGADVLDSSGVLVGTTPTPTITARIGEEVSFTIRKDGYRSLTETGTMSLANVSEPMVLYGQLQVFRPPTLGESWADHMGEIYQSVEQHHLSNEYVAADVWAPFSKSAKVEKGKAETLEYSENGQTKSVIICSSKVADMFCSWLRNGGIKAGFLSEEYEVRPIRDAEFDKPEMTERFRLDDLIPFRVSIRKIVYGDLDLASNPAGADAYVNGQMMGNTLFPLLVPNVRPGKISLLFVLEGYKPLSKQIFLKEGETLNLTFDMVKNQGVVFGKPWENGIHMKFVPVGQDLMASIWETRFCDYEMFARETGRAMQLRLGFDQTPNDPVVNVSREDAKAFC
ncbi:MAG: PEGA domain-containing protein, partial [Gloeobacteraceae cyanobacterium ES-bin-144]|nr:PEGA domain-containing protein [Verrucomicrobiales bacterium]